MTDATGTPTSVYLYYDSRDVLLYVGVTSRSITRNREHNRDKDWWRFVARQEVEHFTTRRQAELRETELIKLHRPPFNTAQNPDAEGARVDYSRFLKTVEIWLDPLDIAKKLKFKMPLLPLQAGPEYKQWIFRSEIEHVVLARELDLKEPLVVTAMDGFQMGRLMSVEQHGPHAIFSFHIRSNTPPMSCWAAEARFVQRPGDEPGVSRFIVRRALLDAKRIPVVRKARKNVAA